MSVEGKGIWEPGWHPEVNGIVYSGSNQQITNHGRIYNTTEDLFHRGHPFANNGFLFITACNFPLYLAVQLTRIGPVTGGDRCFGIDGPASLGSAQDLLLDKADQA